MNFTLIRKWILAELINAVDIASCSRNRCLYIMDVKGMGRSNEILRVDPTGNLINKWPTSRVYGRLSITAESNVVLTVSKKHKIFIYLANGEPINDITSNVGISYPWHAIELTTGHFVVSYGFEANDIHGVCVVDAVGEIVKSFGGKKGSGVGQMNQPIYLAVDGDGFVFVADLNTLICNSGEKFCQKKNMDCTIQRGFLFRMVCYSWLIMNWNLIRKFGEIVKF